jgi:hypothetical protein
VNQRYFRLHNRTDYQDISYLSGTELLTLSTTPVEQDISSKL